MSTPVRANEPRTTGPKHDTWPASLPQVSYVMADGGFLCVTCANQGNGSLATTVKDESMLNNDQWLIIGAQVNETPTVCDHCGHVILTS